MTALLRRFVRWLGLPKRPPAGTYGRTEDML